MKINKSIAPTRILFAMLRVSDLNASIAFYTNLLGMTELQRETFSSAKFTAVYMGYGDKNSETVLELTHNWENEGVEHGTAFGNMSLAVDDVFATVDFLKEQGVKILLPAVKLEMTPDETGYKFTLGHIADPDGYRIELMEMK